MMTQNLERLLRPTGDAEQHESLQTGKRDQKSAPRQLLVPLPPKAGSAKRAIGGNHRAD
jgi:hypothetical protein